MQLKKKDVQTKIQEAALQLFYEKGYAQTKVNDIAKETSISVGNVYTYFKNKDELFYTVVSPNTVEYFEDSLLNLLKSYNDYLTNLVVEEEAFEVIEKNLQILVNNYRELVIILSKNEQTDYEGSKEKIIESIAKDRLNKTLGIEINQEKTVQDVLIFYKIICQSLIDLLINGLKEELETNEERFDLCLALIRYQAKEK